MDKLAVIREYIESNGPSTVSTLAKVTGFPVASVHRWLNQSNTFTQLPDKTWVVGSPAELLWPFKDFNLIKGLEQPIGDIEDTSVSDLAKIIKIYSDYSALLNQRVKFLREVAHKKLS